MRHVHTSEEITNAISRFFAVRGLVRTTLAQGKRLDPSAWLRIETLKFIAQHNESRVKDVADYLSITAPSATSLVSTLVREGLVRQTVSAKDRRASSLALTAKGKKELAQSIERGTQLLGELFATLSPAELAQFTDVLGRLLERSGE